MKNHKAFGFLIFCFVFLFCIVMVACERMNIAKIVKVETRSIPYVSQNSAMLMGAVYDCGDGQIIQYGHCWADHENPDTSDFTTKLGPLSEPDSFISNITNLAPGITYFCRAYGSDGVQVYYGKQRKFVTVPQGMDAVFNKLCDAAAPVIDGVEDLVWEEVPRNDLEKKFSNEMPTITAYWRGMWDDTCIYVIVNVADDNHYPAWEVPSENVWEWDIVELYFDINDTLKDGRGPYNDNSGHYQSAPGFTQYGYDHEQFEDGDDKHNIDSYYAYKLYGENYIYEWRIPMRNFFNINGDRLDIGKLRSKVIGFDVTVVDQDEGITTVRQRRVWQNAPLDWNNESWANMDGCGKVVFR